MMILLFTAMSNRAWATCNTCSPADKIGAAGTTTNASSLTATTGFTNSTICIFGNLNIDVSSFTLSNCVVNMDDDAKITVQSGKTLTISNGTTILSCDQINLWDKIDALTGSAVVVSGSSSKYSTIQDAYMGVSLSGNATITASYTVFNKNYYAVNFIGNSTTQNSSFVDCIMSSNSGANGVNLLAPYTSTKGVYGIYASNVYNLQIGNGTNTSVAFDHLFYDVYGSNFSFTIKKAVFYNAAYAVYHPTQLDKNYGSLIDDCVFDFTNYGVYGTVGSQRNYRIKNCSFTNFDYGVYLQNFKSSTVEVDHNFFNYDVTSNPVEPIDFGGTKYGYKAIYAVNGTKLTAALKIHNNKINNVIEGIAVWNADYTRIYLNCINFLIPPEHLYSQSSNSNQNYWLKAHSGIKYVNCSNTRVYEDTIKRPVFDGSNTENDPFGALPEDIYMWAIYGDNSNAANFVTGNVTYFMYRGMHFNNNNLITITRCNNINNAGSGIYLNGTNGVSTTQFSDQLPGLFDTQNQWSHAYLTVANRRLTGGTANPHLWRYDFSGGSNTSNSRYPANTYSFNTTLANASNFTSCFAIDYYLDTLGTRAILKEIINDNVSYSNNQEENARSATLAAYRTLHSNQWVIEVGNEDDGLFNEFYYNYTASNMGKFIAVQDLILNEEYTQAAEDLELITPSDNYETYIKTCLTIYLQACLIDQRPLDNSEIEDLTEIAYLKVIDGGEAVLYARAMLGIDVSEEEESSGRMAQQQSSNSNEVTVFPNPSKGVTNILINNPTADNKTTVTLFDVRGKILFKKVISDSFEHLTVNLPEGIYILQTTDNTATKSSKVVVN